MSGKGSGDGAERPSRERVSIAKTKLLLGEGKDEELFFRAMLKHLGREDVQVLSAGGKTGLSAALGVLMSDPKWPDVESLLIVRDADFSDDRSRESAASSAWKSVTNELRKRGLPVPDNHGQLAGRGEAVAPAALRVGIFILPDGVSDGMLEDLCLDAVSGDPVKPCLDAYLRCVEEKQGAIVRNLLPKARAHAFLASRSTPDKRVGEAAQAGYWPWEAPAFAPLLAFVAGA